MLVAGVCDKCSSNCAFYKGPVDVTTFLAKAVIGRMNESGTLFVISWPTGSDNVSW